MNDFPKTCCKNIAMDGPGIACDKPAVYWYNHNDYICSFCEKHNYVCGERVYPLVKLILEYATNNHECQYVTIPFEYSSKEEAIADFNTEIEKAKKFGVYSQFKWLHEIIILNDVYFHWKDENTYTIKTLDEWFAENKI